MAPGSGTGEDTARHAPVSGHGAGKEQQEKGDPQRLAAADAIVADAFADVGDAEEATKWRRKSETAAEKAKRARDDRR